MKIILSETQYDTLIEQMSSTLTVPEQTLLGFLNNYLRGEQVKYEKMSDEKLMDDEKLRMELKRNEKYIYPMVLKLLEKKKTGKKTYDDKMFNLFFFAMDGATNKDQRFEFFKDAANLTDVKYSSQY